VGKERDDLGLTCDLGVDAADEGVEGADCVVEDLGDLGSAIPARSAVSWAGLDWTGWSVGVISEKRRGIYSPKEPAEQTANRPTNVHVQAGHGGVERAAKVGELEVDVDLGGGRGDLAAGVLWR
jgi:hypothetical protein